MRHCYETLQNPYSQQMNTNILKCRKISPVSNFVISDEEEKVKLEMQIFVKNVICDWNYQLQLHGCTESPSR